MAVAALALLAPDAHAQLSIGADVQSAGGYVWRGITRSQVGVIQPAVAVTLPPLCSADHLFCSTLSGGLWMNWQPGRAGDNELSDLSPGKRGISELDLWVEAAARGEMLELAVGSARYIYPASGVGAERTPTENTTELYARVRFPRVPWVKPSVVVWWDIDHVRGVYVEPSAVAGIGVLPGLLNIDIGAAAGISLGQDSSYSWPMEGFNSEHMGLAYLESTLGLSVHPKQLAPVRLALDVHFQWSFDDLTRRASRAPGEKRTFSSWITASAGYTFTW